MILDHSDENFRRCLMSVSGHFRKFGLVTEMSGLPSEADIGDNGRSEKCQ